MFNVMLGLFILWIISSIVMLVVRFDVRNSYTENFGFPFLATFLILSVVVGIVFSFRLINSGLLNV